jgi:hypothetical protein
VISTATDVVLGHGDPLRSVLDLNFQSGREAGLPGRICLYNAALHHRLHVPVHSVVVLLRPKADDSNITGRLTYTGQPRRGKMDFQYEVFRIWQLPAKRLLRCGPGVLPLSVLGALPPGVSDEDGVADVVDQICRRMERTHDPELAKHVLTSTFVLTGLRLKLEQAINVFRRVQPWKNRRPISTFSSRGPLSGRRSYCSGKVRPSSARRPSRLRPLSRSWRIYRISSAWAIVCSQRTLGMTFWRHSKRTP